MLSTGERLAVNKLVNDNIAPGVHPAEVKKRLDFSILQAGYTYLYEIRSMVELKVVGS